MEIRPLFKKLIKELFLAKASGKKEKIKKIISILNKENITAKELSEGVHHQYCKFYGQ